MLLFLIDGLTTIFFVSQMVTDKVKELMKDMHEAKSNHMQLREETSKEFRKAYKRIGAMEKEIDMVNYRQHMAAKKVLCCYISLQ